MIMMVTYEKFQWHVQTRYSSEGNDCTGSATFSEIYKNILTSTTSKSSHGPGVPCIQLL
jgi:hypothetical protein